MMRSRACRASIQLPTFWNRLPNVSSIWAILVAQRSPWPRSRHAGMVEFGLRSSRTRRLIMAGDPASLSLAHDTLHPVSVAPFAAVRAQAIELAVLSGADDRAFDVTRTTLSRLPPNLDEFDAILFHAYLELLTNRSGTHRRVPPDLVAEHVRWTSNVSEHLFSVAIRAMRSGLYHAAVLLLDRFLTGGAPADERLFVESRAHHAHLCEWLEGRGSQAA